MSNNNEILDDLEFIPPEKFSVFQFVLKHKWKLEGLFLLINIGVMYFLTPGITGLANLAFLSFQVFLGKNMVVAFIIHPIIKNFNKEILHRTIARALLTQFAVLLTILLLLFWVFYVD